MSSRHAPSVERVPLIDGHSGYLLVTPNKPDGRKAIVGHGFLSNPYHCIGVAEALALEGITVGIVDYGEPIPGEELRIPSDFKYDRTCKVIEDMQKTGTSDGWFATVHSYGGVVLKKLLDDSPVEFEEAHFVSALGFGEPVKVLHPNRFIDVIRMYGAELFSAAARPRKILNPHALKAQSLSLKHRDQRRRELTEITELETNYALTTIRKAQKAGTYVVVAIAPRDNVVNPNTTTISMEGEVEIIHPKANHFSFLTHGSRVVKIVLGLDEEILDHQ